MKAKAKFGPKYILQLTFCYLVFLGLFIFLFFTGSLLGLRELFSDGVRLFDKLRLVAIFGMLVFILVYNTVKTILFHAKSKVYIDEEKIYIKVYGMQKVQFEAPLLDVEFVVTRGKIALTYNEKGYVVNNVSNAFKFVEIALDQQEYLRNQEEIASAEDVDEIEEFEEIE